MSDRNRIGLSEGVGTITPNRPARRNAPGAESTAGLAAAPDRLAADPDCRAVVLTGPPPAFCSGSDPKELGTLDLPGRCRHVAGTARGARSIGMLPCRWRRRAKAMRWGAA